MTRRSLERQKPERSTRTSVTSFHEMRRTVPPSRTQIASSATRTFLFHMPYLPAPGPYPRLYMQRGRQTYVNDPTHLVPRYPQVMALTRPLVRRAEQLRLFAQDRLVAVGRAASAEGAIRSARAVAPGGRRALPRQ